MTEPTNHTQQLQCPHCQQVNTGHVGGVEPPKVGDLSICAHCLGLAQVTQAGAVVYDEAQLPESERADFEALREGLRALRDELTE